MDAYERLAMHLRIETAWQEQGRYAARKSQTPVDEAIAAQAGDEEENYRSFFTPDAEFQLSSAGSSLDGRSIREELAEMRYKRTMRPFVEGEAIGAYAPHPVREPLKELAHPGDVRQLKLFALRAQNEKRIKAILGED